MNQFIAIVKMFLVCTSFSFFGYLILKSFHFLFLNIRENLALYRYCNQKKLRNRLQHEYYIPVSILLATHEDEDCIVDVVDSLLSLQYKLYEIVIIDDGSHDKTVDTLVKTFQLKKTKRPIRKQLPTRDIEAVYQTNHQNIKITLLKKERGGIADAFNAGINVSNYPYFLCINSSCILQHDALENLIRPVLEDDNVTVCSGVFHVGKRGKLKDREAYKYHFPKSILAKGQALEYPYFTFVTRKRLEELKGSASFCLFKKEEAIRVLGYDVDAVGENFELLAKIKEACHIQGERFLIKYAPDAICYMEVPSNITTLYRQRKAWNRGLLQVIKRYQRNFPMSKHKIREFLTFFSFAIFDFYAPFIEIFGLLITILTCYLGFCNSLLSGLFLLSYVLFCGCLSLCLFITKLWTENTQISFWGLIKGIVSCFIEQTVLKFLVFFAKIASFFKSKKSVAKKRKK